MYPDLSYFFHDVFGTEPDNWTSIFKTFGLFLVLAILLASYLLYKELKRKAEQGLFTYVEVKKIQGQGATPTELIWNAFFGFVVGFKAVYIIQHFAAFQADASAVLLSAKGNWLAGIVGAGIFAAIRYREKTKDKLDKPKTVIEKVYPYDRIGDITIVAAVSGIIGAKVFALVEDLPSFFNDPIGMFFSGSGLAIYGGLIGGFIGVWWYLRSKNIPFLPVADGIAPGMMIAYGVGRMGCQFSGDGDWGDPAAAMPDWWFLPDWLWSYNYPNNVAQQGVPIEGCTYDYCMQLIPEVYPTPLYEIIMALLLGLILWNIRKRFKIGGVLFFVYLIFNGIERFTIEQIRINDEYNVLGFYLTQAEIIAILLFIIGVAGVLFLRNRHNKTAKAS
ncbi:MAG: prolipoprotein diacylglyceryl transferase [Saprospiraceae bacterium]|nr:prolipoprotein diacylglyceryl transferase [Saprospiraceae bacterium]